MATRKAKTVAFTTYRPDQKQQIVERAAHALDWAATRFPGQVVPYNLLLKGVMGYAKMPRLQSNEVDQLRKRTSRIRKLLEKVYGRALITVTGVGVRASVDSEDAIRNAVKPAGQRLERAAQLFKQRMGLVNPAEVKDKELQSWLRGAKAHVKQIDGGMFSNLAKPPKQIEGAKNEKGKPKK